MTYKENDSNITVVNELGKTFKTNRKFRILSQEECDAIRSEWYKLPTKEQVEDNILLIMDGGQDLSVITKFFYRDLMDDVSVYNTKYTINQVLNNNVLLSYVYDTTLENKKVFNETTAKNIDASFRLRGGHFARKATQFPIKYVDHILEKYCLNDNYLDTSCGWGSRLASALRNGYNYFGTDPNDLLVERLYNYKDAYFNCALKGVENKPIVDIRCQGSETFIPEWRNKMGIMFTSPPYFSLEDYAHGDKQSYKDGTTYEEWLERFLIPTMLNVKEYLVENACMVINIKDFGGFSLENDTIECAKKCGFYLLETDTLKQGTNRPKNTVEIDSSEKIYVFCRDGEKNNKKHIEQMSLFDYE